MSSSESLRKPYLATKINWFQGVLLKQTHFSYVKQNIRVLGLTLKPINEGVLVIGAVFRGSDSLDGVLSGVLGQDFSLLELCELVQNSKHWGQIRVIVFRSSELPCDPLALAGDLGKPVLVINERGECDPLYSMTFEGVIVTPVGLDEHSALRVLRVLYRNGSFPVLDYCKLITEGVE